MGIKASACMHKNLLLSWGGGVQKLKKVHINMINAHVLVFAHEDTIRSHKNKYFYTSS